jgi:hypothetical protein
LVDLDGDGRTDVISGSFPGEIYFFQQQRDGKFAPGKVLVDKDSKPLNIGSASAAFAADWNGNGRKDLVVGNILGEVYLIPNEGKGKELVFGTPRRLEAAGQPIKVKGDAAPVVADWDGDGIPDLLVGSEDGSVVWFRNVGTARKPDLEAARPLIAPSPLGWGGDEQRRDGQWGLRVKFCVVDWYGDGRLSILLGDRCGGFRAKPSQTEEEKAEERKANDVLPRLRQEWTRTFQAYQKLDDPPPGETEAGRLERMRKRDVLRATMVRLKDEMAAVQTIQERFQPGYQTHGFVWLFQRKPPARKGP